MKLRNFLKLSKTPKIGLIMSGGYVNESLSAEMGHIPPSMLPLGNEQLLFHQVKFLKKFVDEVYVLFPETYVLHAIDKMRIENCGLHILNVNPDVSIGCAISLCINSICFDNYELYMLYGDTLFDDLERFNLDSVSVHKKWGEYGWASIDILQKQKVEIDDDLTLSGLFSFADVNELSKCLDHASGDFLEALNIYSERFPLEYNQSGQWYDFGHVQTYFRSVGLVTTQRSFNALDVTKNTYQKSSLNHNKIIAEASWFENLPAHLRLYTPAFLGFSDVENRSSYQTENTFLSTLSNLATFGDLQKSTWDKIYNACEECLNDFKNVVPNFEIPINYDDYFLIKTNKRLEKFFDSKTGEILKNCDRVNNINIPTLDEILLVTKKIINNRVQENPCLVHGDFCFSNIFYDFRSSSIQVIDPRGELPNGTPSMYGLPSYDIAKIAHSALGGYDLIIANYLPSTVNDTNIEIDLSFQESERCKKFIDAFLSSNIYRCQDQDFLYSMIVHLFLSMLPLHSDRPDRQISMFAVAMLLYKRYIG